MCDELEELSKFIERFNRVLHKSVGCENTEDDKDFINYYQLHLAIAIMLSIGDNNAKKVAKMILAQVE